MTTASTLTPAEAQARARANAPALLADLESGSVVLSPEALRAAMAASGGPASPEPAPAVSVFRRFRFESDAQYQSRVSSMLTRASEAERITRMSAPWEPPASARAEWPRAALGGTGLPPAGVEAVAAAMDTPFGVAPVLMPEPAVELTLAQLADQVDDLCSGTRVVMPAQRTRAARPDPVQAAAQRDAVADAVASMMDAEPCA